MLKVCEESAYVLQKSIWSVSYIFEVAKGPRMILAWPLAGEICGSDVGYSLSIDADALRNKCHHFITSS
jgi:hypothetical protein